MNELISSQGNEFVNSKENIFIKSSNERYLGNSQSSSNNKPEVLFLKSARSLDRGGNHYFMNEIETDGGFNNRLDKYKDSKLLNKEIKQNKVKSKLLY